ncbi:MAG: pentapeptide repeat-containing protein [Mesorhizobium sp.]|nr:pentapeptide repeat-containing protein [Mesorhizobium sp.]
MTGLGRLDSVRRGPWRRVALRTSLGSTSTVKAALMMVASLMALSVAEAAPDCQASAAPGIDWTGCSKKVIVISGSDLNGATLVETDFTSTDLRDSNLMAANFEKATLVRASLAGSQAQGAKFDRIEAYRTNFSGLLAKGSTFASAELQRSNFTNANLVDVDFTKADLGRADFTGADITGSRFALANLSRADLSKVQFSGALDFESAFLFLTRIEGQDLSAATGLQQWQVDMACGDAQTKLPTGITAPGNWPCVFD